jgi:hypothetical protein
LFGTSITNAVTVASANSVASAAFMCSLYSGAAAVLASFHLWCCQTRQVLSCVVWECVIAAAWLRDLLLVLCQERHAQHVHQPLRRPVVQAHIAGMQPFVGLTCNLVRLHTLATPSLLRDLKYHRHTAQFQFRFAKQPQRMPWPVKWLLL